MKIVMNEKARERERAENKEGGVGVERSLR